jgi:hypothetical protein
VATFTHDDVAAMAASVEGAPSDLLTVGNPKIAKGEKYGYLTAGLHLAPYKLAGFNMCAKATAGCAAACLNTSGRGYFDSKLHVARIRKTKWLRNDRQAFFTKLHKEIATHERYCVKRNLKPVARLNILSDFPWENAKYIRPDGSVGNIFDAFPNVQFYDYTKIAARFAKNLPANYDLTFSAADGNEEDVKLAQSYGARVAIVFRNRQNPRAQARRWNLPDNYNGIPLVDGDDSDLRFLDPPGCIIGLKVKGNSAWKDTTGFVRDIDPA